MYTVASLVIPLSYPSSRWPLLSLPRFGLAIFPFFLALAVLGGRPRVHTAIVACSSMLLGVVVNGVPLAADDATPAPNTRTDLPGVGYVVLNEQTVTGDGVHSSSMTVNMIHVYVRDALTGVTTGEIVVGSAQSAVAL